jgi:hypothetical protein
LTNAGEARAVSVFVVASSGSKGRPERIIAASFAALWMCDVVYTTHPTSNSSKRETCQERGFSE